MTRSAEPTPANPYRDLHVYYLRGRLRPGLSFTHRDFLGNWEEDGYSFLFFGRPARMAIETLVAAEPELELLDETAMSYEQWQGGHIGAMTVAGFTIVPPWEQPAAGPGRTIVLDPGVVFGNGLHPTTRDCLAAIALASREGPVRSAVDLGTGTGVLALAAACCGGNRVLAVDNNPLCGRTAAANVRRNAMQHRILVIQGRAEDHAGIAVDLMVANIHYDVMQHLLTAQNLHAKRHVVLSGLLRSEAREVASRLAALSVEVQQQWACDGIWHTFYAICR